jgi:hypothetical protein
MELLRRITVVLILAGVTSGCGAVESGVDVAAEATAIVWLEEGLSFLVQGR